MGKRYGDQLRGGVMTCPVCGGILEKKKGPYGEFYGCSYSRDKGCTYKLKMQEIVKRQGLIEEL